MCIRQLKKGTIEDHIVELALKIQKFSIEPICYNGKTTANSKGSKKIEFKTARSLYIMKFKMLIILKLRLVLAKYGDE